MSGLKKLYEKYPNCNQTEITILLFSEVLETLKSMKQQEFDYWEAWKKAKTKEQTTVEKERQPK